MGFRVVRRGFYWTSIEEEKGVYDFADYDDLMEHAKDLGLTIVGCLFGNNKLYEDDGLGGIQTEAGRQGFANFAAALADHYKDHAVLWEVWNEPNVRSFWRNNGQHNSEEFAEDYTALVKETAAAMLEVDPDCFVMAGSVSNYWEPSYEWTESCFKRRILQSGIRGWSVHPYGVKTPEEFAVGHNRTRELLKQYGAPDMPLLNTERGFAVKGRRLVGRVERTGSRVPGVEFRTPVPDRSVARRPHNRLVRMGRRGIRHRGGGRRSPGASGLPGDVRATNRLSSGAPYRLG